MYNLFFIKKVLQQRKQFSIRKLAEKYGLSSRTIQNWEQGKLSKGKRNKPNTVLDIKLLIEDVKQYPDAYQYERAQRLNVSQTCIGYNLKKLGLTYKKTLKHPKTDEEKRLLFQKKIADYKAKGLDVCYLDESGHALDMPRTHGYAIKGQRCYGTHDWGAKGRVNVIGALIGKLLFAVGLFNCNVDNVVFGSWVKQLLLPSLSKPTVIVMDNATFHKNQSILNAIKVAGHIVEFLPAYSPDLNPIEHKWAEKKSYRRKYRCTIDECYM